MSLCIPIECRKNWRKCILIRSCNSLVLTNATRTFSWDSSKLCSRIEEKWSDCVMNSHVYHGSNLIKYNAGKLRFTAFSGINVISNIIFHSSSQSSSDLPDKNNLFLMSPLRRPILFCSHFFCHPKILPKGSSRDVELYSVYHLNRY